MSKKEEVTGSLPAKLVGVFICICSVVMFGVWFFVTDSIDIRTLIFISVASFGMIFGIGLIHLNYYAWLTAIYLNVIVVIFGMVALAFNLIYQQFEVSSNLAVNLTWPVIFLSLLYASRNACRAKREQRQNFFDSIKNNVPALGATFLTVATIIITKAYGFSNFIKIGFPLLIIEFTIFYVAGQTIQKKCGWDNTNF